MSWKTRIIPTATTLSVLLLSVVLYPQTTNTLIALSQAGKTILSPNLFYSLLQQTGTPGAGEQVLPLPVQSMLSLLRANRISSFRYSEAIGANEEIRQRLLEGALPARYEPTASNLLIIDGEPIPPDFKPLASHGGVILVHRA